MIFSFKGKADYSNLEDIVKIMRTLAFEGFNGNASITCIFYVYILTYFYFYSVHEEKDEENTNPKDSDKKKRKPRPFTPRLQKISHDILLRNYDIEKYIIKANAEIKSHHLWAKRKFTRKGIGKVWTQIIIDYLNKHQEDYLEKHQKARDRVIIYAWNSGFNMY